MGFPRHASIGLFDALLEEYRRLGEACPPSWVKGVADRLAAADAIMPFPVPLESLGVEWSFQIRDYLRPYVTGVTYYGARRAAVSAGGIMPQDRFMGPEPPRTTGSLRAAASLTFGLSAPPGIFRPGARGPPMSELGPGLHHPITLATEGDTLALRRALLGNAALRKEPWVAVGKDGTLLPIPVPPGTTPPPKNHGSASCCGLCGESDSVWHSATSCRHRAMVAVRASIVQDATKTLLPWLVEELRRLARAPGDGGAPLVPAFSVEEEAALAGIPTLPSGGAELPNELRHVLYRLVTASPWPRRAAPPGAHLTAAVGELFDAVIAAPHSVRGLANRWVRWSRVAIEKLAKARWSALVAEAAAPTLPRPPAWVPPPPVEADARDGPGTVPKFARGRTIVVGRTPVSWYKACNKAALECLLERARLDPLVAPRIAQVEAATVGFGNKHWLEQVLFGLELDRPTLGRLQAPGPA